VRADGYQPFGGAVEVTATDERLTPPLVPLRAPPPETLLALAGGPPALIAVIERAGGPWHVSLRAVAPDGNARALERPVDADSAAPATAELMHQLLDAPAPPPLVAAPAPIVTPSKRGMPAWGWGLLGGVAATLAIVVPIAVVYGQPSPQGTIGGRIGPLK
jgi:hypothetical protein